MEICYNHVFIYAEFEIINVIFKERRNQYATFSTFFMFLPRFQFGRVNLVKSHGNPLVKMCKNPGLN